MPKTTNVFETPIICAPSKKLTVAITSTILDRLSTVSWPAKSYPNCEYRFDNHLRNSQSCPPLAPPRANSNSFLIFPSTLYVLKLSAWRFRMLWLPGRIDPFSHFALSPLKHYPNWQGIWNWCYLASTLQSNYINNPQQSSSANRWVVQFLRENIFLPGDIADSKKKIYITQTANTRNQSFPGATVLEDFY